MKLMERTDEELINDLAEAFERIEQAKRDFDSALIACFDRPTVTTRQLLPYVDCGARMLRYRVAEARRRAAL